MNRLLAIPVLATVLAVGVLVTQTPSYSEPVASQITAVGDDYPAVWKNELTSSMIDSWGMGNRQCVSWTAWKVWQTYHISAYKWGDANDWPMSAVADGQTLSEIPVVHSVAIDTSYSPGHAMWVEAKNDDGAIHVSEYNHEPGAYTERDIPPDGLTYIIIKKR